VQSLKDKAKHISYIWSLKLKMSNGLLQNKWHLLKLNVIMPNC